MKKLLTYILLSLILILICIPASAKTGQELLKLAQQRSNFYNQSQVITMKTTINKQQETDKATLKIYVYQGGKKELVSFTAPQRLADQKYLVIGSNTWLHQEGLRRPIRISARQKLFGDAGIGETVGIDYYNQYNIQKVTKDNSLYTLKLKAKTKQTTYQQAKAWITKDGYFKKVILKAVNGSPLKKIEYQDYRKINNHEVANLVIKNLLHQQNRTTTLKYINIEQKKLPAKAFQPLMMDKFKLLIKQAGD